MFEKAKEIFITAGWDCVNRIRATHFIKGDYCLSYYEEYDEWVETDLHLYAYENRPISKEKVLEMAEEWRAIK